MAKKKTKKVSKAKLTPVTHADGWSNVITGLGTTKDKNTYASLDWTRTDRSTAESFFSADEMGAKIARIIPYDGTREGLTWNMDVTNNQEEIIKFIEGEFLRLKAWKTFGWAWTLARAYGGACVYMSIDDGRSPDKPVNMKKIKSIKTLTVFDRWELNTMCLEIIDDLGDPNYGLPKFYYYNASNGTSNSAEEFKIHHSRMIRFDGVKLPTHLYKRNDYWHDSIYGSMNKAIRNYANVHENISMIISDFNQPVYKIEGLSEAIAQDEEELVLTKLNQVNLMRSAARAIILDTTDEFQNVSTNVAGGKDLIELTIQRLVAGSDIPHTRLLGNSPTGLGATGESELINYYDSVKSMQYNTLSDPVEQITDLIFLQLDKNMKKPEDLRFIFTPLFQLSQEKEAKARQMQAEIDERYITLGVYDAEEVAESRFSTGRYSYETTLAEGKKRGEELAFNPKMGAGDKFGDNASAMGDKQKKKVEALDDLDGL